MSRANVLILIATALLGVLLWLVDGIVREAVSPSPPVAKLPDTAAETAAKTFADGQEAGTPHLVTRDDLAMTLAELGVDPDAALASYLRWRDRRGFHDPEPPFASARESVARDQRHAVLDDATLLSLAGNGDLGAMHSLAERSLPADPLDALEWYERAARRGSLFAMLRLGDLLDTLGDPALDRFVADAEQLAAIAELRAHDPGPAEQSLAWSLAAASAGGLPILDAATIRRVAAQAAALDAAGVRRACMTSQDYVLDVAAARRSVGEGVFGTEAPDVFITPLHALDAWPCESEFTPIVATTDCTDHPIVTDAGQTRLLWLCDS